MATHIRLISSPRFATIAPPSPEGHPVLRFIWGTLMIIWYPFCPECVLEKIYQV